MNTINLSKHNEKVKALLYLKFHLKNNAQKMNAFMVQDRSP